MTTEIQERRFQQQRSVYADSWALLRQSQRRLNATNASDMYDSDNSEHSEIKHNNHSNFTIDEDDDDSYTGSEEVTNTLETGVLTSKRLNRRSIISRLKDEDSDDILPCRSLMLKSQRGLYFYDDDDTADTESLEEFEDEDNINKNKPEIKLTVLDIEKSSAKLEALESSDMEQSSKKPKRSPIAASSKIGLQNCASCLSRIPILIRQSLEH